MNCRPGDLAMVVKPAFHGRCLCYMGRPLVVKVTFRANDGLDWWEIDPPWEPCSHAQAYGYSDVSAISDRVLRPIRPPETGLEAHQDSRAPTDAVTT